MVTKWNLKLLYSSTRDKRIEKELKEAENVVKTFVKKYKDIDFCVNENSLYSALYDYEKLCQILENARPIIYYYYRYYLDNADHKAESAINKLTQFYTGIENRLTFFILKIGRISNNKQRDYLKSEILDSYRYLLRRVFEEAKYHLSEKEENLINLKSLTSRTLWIRDSEKLSNKQTVKFHGSAVPISEASNIVHTLKTKDRRELHNSIVVKLKSISDFAEAEMNAIILDEKINDELRGFKKVYDSVFLSHETMESEVMQMVSCVRSHYFIGYDFYDVKGKMLGLKQLYYADRGADINSFNKKISFKDASGLLSGIYESLGEKYVELFNSFLMNGQIDVYPKANKASGAFCSSSYNNPTFVLLNYVNDLSSLTTFAHEMGHAFHSEFSKKQSVVYQDYSTVTAETASAFFEEILYDKLKETLDKREWMILLHNKINEETATIFRQIACFQFELELHDKVRKNGFVPKEDMAQLMNDYMSEYLGPKFKIDEIDGYYFVMWPHIRSFFYVYSYAYGKLVSKSLFRKYKEDNCFISKVEKILEAGGSDTPHNILKKAGIDTNLERVWKDGLKQLQDEVDELKSLACKYGN